MSFITKDEEIAKKEIKEKILGGWIIINGEDELIEMLEKAIYPPDTPKNGDFLLYFGQDLSPDKTQVGYLYLARKNEDLLSFVRRSEPTLTDNEWERIIEITLLPANSQNGDTAMVITYLKEPTTTPSDASNFIESFLEDMASRHKRVKN